MNRYDNSTAHCELCGRPLPADRVRYRVRQCCPEGNRRDQQTLTREQTPFTAAEFLARVEVLAVSAHELLAEASTHVQPSSEVGCALGALAAASNVLHMLHACGEPEGWTPIAPCDECGGAGQHRLGCSRD